MAVRTNLITNPSFEVDSTSWGLYGSTAAISSAQAFSGTKSWLITGNGGFGPTASYNLSLSNGVQYTASAYIRATAGNQVRMESYNTAVGSYVTATGGWDRITLTWTAAVSTVNIQVTGTTLAGSFYLDAVLLEQSGTIGGYFDGSTVAGGFTYAWTGAANASTSTETPVAASTTRKLTLLGVG